MQFDDPTGAPVVLRSNAEFVPPLVRGHSASFRGFERLPGRPYAARLYVDTWLHDMGFESVRLFGEQGWFRTMGPDEAARLHYIGQQDFQEPAYTEELVPYQNAWYELRSFLRKREHPHHPFDLTDIWGSHTADDIAAAFGLHLETGAREDLSHRWEALLKAHEVIMGRYLQFQT